MSKPNIKNIFVEVEGENHSKYGLFPLGLHQFFDQSAAHLHYDLHFLGNKATKNLVFMGFYRKYERLKNASNPVIISI